MSGNSHYAAIDLGAESGRVMAARLSAESLTMREVHRFANEPVWYNGGLHWDVARLWLEIQRGLRLIASTGAVSLEGLGVDTWGLDFALLGENGVLLDNPFHYRDGRTDGLVEHVCSIVPAEEIYSLTGIQFMQINSLYQLFATQLKTPGILRSARMFLTIPDLMNYWLTGEVACEYTNATTTQFVEVRERTWSSALLERLDIPTHFLPRLVQTGTVLGPLLPEIAGSVGIEVPSVIAPACHDTGSAVAAIPLDADIAYISSGTWSLLGCERSTPVITEEARILNFTNEGGAFGTFRLLKNITGMWLLECCRRVWKAEGRPVDYADLMEAAERCPPLHSLVDPDHVSFVRPVSMPDAIAEFCRRTGQRVPQTQAAFTRCVLDSLAMKYRYVLEMLEGITTQSMSALRIVGGGAKNRLLNRLTASATARRVLAGPIEATALGNIAVQMIATGEVSTLMDARQIIDRSFPPEIFNPDIEAPWDEAAARFKQYCAVP